MNNYEPSIGDIVILKSGGPPMTVIEITAPGRDADGVDVVTWWRDDEREPQVMEIDARCLSPVREVDHGAAG